MHTFKYGTILVVFGLSACMTPRPAEVVPGANGTYKKPLTTIEPQKPMPVESAEIKKQPQAKIGSWEIRGALAARTPKKGWSATLNWMQNGPNAYQIRLMGPLGNGAVIITKQDGFVTFKDGPRTTTSTNAEALLFKQTGARLPVDNLYYWVRGLPAPGEVQSQNRDSANHLVSINQHGYRVTFMEYTMVNGTALPSAIRMEGKGLMVKVMIKRWITH